MWYTDGSNFGDSFNFFFKIQAVLRKILWSFWDIAMLGEVNTADNVLSFTAFINFFSQVTDTRLDLQVRKGNWKDSY